MPEYNDNAICDYVMQTNSDYYCSLKDNWLLLYGNSDGIPKLLVFVNKTENMSPASEEEKYNINLGCKIAHFLKLPFMCVRFMPHNEQLSVWESKTWKNLTYDRLRDLFEKYGVVEAGTAKKAVNQYLSSPYHDWQRNNLGRITVCDLDMIQYKENRIAKIVELKRSEKSLDVWKPYPADYPNFSLVINAIVHSGEEIPFFLYYNYSQKISAQERQDDISEIRVFQFEVPEQMIKHNELQYRDHGNHTIDEVLLNF